MLKKEKDTNFKKIEIYKFKNRERYNKRDSNLKKREIYKFKKIER
jgi:hypothetical protein